MDNKLMVSVSMITYKHEAFIQHAIEGVLIQETNFEYDLIIADDCSPDKTQEIVENIIASHPKGNLIKYFRHKKNIGMQPNGFFVANQCHGKYIAICEGDDYWTDPLKLQKQVDFLEANEKYGMVHTDFIAYNELLQKMENYFPKADTNDSCFYNLLTENNSIGTLTVCFRKQLLLDYFNEINPNQQNWLLGDLPLWLYIANKSKIHFINEITAVYRRLNESASNFQNYDNKINFEQSVYDVRMFFYQKFSPNNIRTKKRIKFLFSTNKLRINLNFNGSFLQFIFLFISSLYVVVSKKNFIEVLKLGLLKLSLLLKK